MVKGAPDYAGVAKRVMRPDIYLEAMKEMGVTPKVAPLHEVDALGRRAVRCGEPGTVRALVSHQQSRGVTDDSSNASDTSFCRSSGSRSRAWHGGLPARVVTDLPSPLKTWEESKLYLLEPWAKRGEMDQGMGRLAYYSLVRVAHGFSLGILIGTPLGFLLGVSSTMHRMFDPVIQVLRPISPLAWLPLGLVLFQKSEPAALFAIAVCSMWPTVLNTMAGVRAIPQDYWNVAKVLRLSRFTTFTKIVLPATLPHMFTGFRLSLGIAWLVIVASEMLTGTPGVGGFLWQEYNSLIYSHILLAILTIGVVGFCSIA